MVYDCEEEDIDCSMACTEAGWCQCSKCRLVSVHHHIVQPLISDAWRCCNKCSARCLKFPLGVKLDADEMLAAILGLGDDSFKSVLKSIKYWHTAKCSLNSFFHSIFMHPGLPKQIWWANLSHPRGSLLVFSVSQHWWSTCPTASAMPVQGEVAGGEQHQGA